MRIQLILLAAVVALSSAACTTTRGKKGSVDNTGGAAASGTSDFSTPYTGGAADAGGNESTLGAGDGAGSADGGFGAASDDLSQRVIYFDLDSAEIRTDGLAVVDAWSKYLVTNGSAKIRLEGHADERGTREYNVALGERRANAVLQAMTARGVGAAQISVVSFGEERPLALGHDDGAWGQNRRVEIVQP